MSFLDSAQQKVFLQQSVQEPSSPMLSQVLVAQDFPTSPLFHKQGPCSL